MARHVVLGVQWNLTTAVSQHVKKYANPPHRRRHGIVDRYDDDGQWMIMDKWGSVGW